MSLWRLVRDEVAGGYRSVRYDLGRRSGPRYDRTDVLYPEYDAYEGDDRRRRATVATGLGLILATAVVGVYFAVAGGMGVLLAYGSPGSGAGSTAVSGSPSPSPSPSASPSPSPSPSASPSLSPSVHRSPIRRPTPRSTRTTPAPPATSTPPTNSPSPTTAPTVTSSPTDTASQKPAEQP